MHSSEMGRCWGGGIAYVFKLDGGYWGGGSSVCTQVRWGDAV